MDKREALKEVIGRYRSAVIAFSGGVDSTFLARAAKDVLGGRVKLIIATSSTYPFAELEEAKRLASEHLRMDHEVIVSEEVDIPGFSDNPPDRCYYCKSELFDHVGEIARREGYEAVFDGSNADDLKDFRPGRKALKEKGVVSPLVEAGLGKEDIRRFSRDYGLPTADKPSFACLASRFPYGEQITAPKLNRVDKAEAALRELGLVQFRVRSHGDLARVEVAGREMEQAWNMRAQIDGACRDAGFVFVALDLKGYRTGAMNEALDRARGGDAED